MDLPWRLVFGETDKDIFIHKGFFFILIFSDITAKRKSLRNERCRVHVAILTTLGVVAVPRIAGFKKSLASSGFKTNGFCT